MIIVCPNCSSRYLLSASAIGETGREVRCANCGHQWFQEAKRPEPLFDPSPQEMEDIDVPNEDDDFDVPSMDAEQEEESSNPIEEAAREFEKPLPEEPIPDSVKPLPEGSNFPAFRPPADELPHNPKAKASAWFLSLFLLAGILVSLLLYKDIFVQAFPAASGFYNSVGMDVPLVGEGLIIEKAKAVVVNENGQDILVVSGNILNLKRASIVVPPIVATLRDENGENGESFQIEPPVNIVEPGASFPFTMEYPNVSDAATSVNLTFVLKMQS